MTNEKLTQQEKLLNNKVLLYIVKNEENLKGKNFDTVSMEIIKKGRDVVGKKWSGNKIRTAVQDLVKQRKISFDKNEKFVGVEGLSNVRSRETGIYYRTGNGFGGKIVVDGQEKCFVVSKNIAKENNLETGDIVEFEKSPIGNLFSIINVKKTKNKVLSGYIFTQQGKVRFVEKKKNGAGQILTVSNDPNGELVRSAIAHYVNVEVIDNGICSIKNVFGAVSDWKSREESIVEKIEMSRDYFDKKSLAEASEIANSNLVDGVNLVDENGIVTNGKTIDKSKSNYLDWTNKFIIAEDPLGAQDRDDAIYTEINKKGNYVVYVAIADVTEKINPNDAPHLWNDAVRRASSFYGLNIAYDMLPHEVVCGNFSLDEGKDRLTLSGKMEIDRVTGKVLNWEPVSAVINVKKATTYDYFEKFLDGQEDYINQVYKNALQSALSSGENYVPKNAEETAILNRMCSDVLLKDEESRNSLDVDAQNESKFVFDKTLTNIIDVKLREQLRECKTISTYMIANNAGMAKFASDNDINVLYRVHGVSDEKKIDRFNACLATCGYYDLEWDGTIRSAIKILEEIKGDEDEEIIKQSLIPNLARAEYSVQPHPTDYKTGDVLEEELCHAALGLPYYSHTTSPIRRVSDMITHYAIKTYLRTGKNAFDKDWLRKTAEHINAREKEFDDAVKELYDCAFAIYARNKINETFSGKVCSISSDYVTLLTEQNMRINIPTYEFASTGKFSVSEFGTELIKDGRVILQMSETKSCKISGTNIVEGRVYGSTDFTKNFSVPSSITEDEIKKEIEDYVSGKIDNMMMDVFGNIEKEIKAFEAGKDRRGKRWSNSKRYK